MLSDMRERPSLQSAVVGPPLANARPVSRPRWTLDREMVVQGEFAFFLQDAVWFAGTFLVSLLGGAWMLYVSRIFVGDALARAANAHHVLFSRDPHLAAIGFIWPPLPSFVEIPFVALLRPLGQAWFAPQIMSALFTAGLIVLLNRVLIVLGVSTRWRVPTLLAVALNPLIFFSAINGMTENVFLFFVVGAVYYMLVWQETSSTPLIIFGAFAGLAFFVRYESVAFAGAGTLAVLIMTASTRNQERTEALLTTYLAPVAFVMLLWVFWNQLFLGDALYFLRAVGSNEFYTGGLRDPGVQTELAQAFHSPVETLVFTARRLYSIFPAFIPAMVLGTVMMFRTRDRVLLSLLVMAASVPLFNMLQVYRGQLFEWARFWSIIVVFTPIVAAAAIRHLPRRWRNRALGVTAVLCLASGVLSGLTMTGDVASPDERQFIESITSGIDGVTTQRDDTLDQLEATAAYLDALPPVQNEPPIIAIDTFVHAALVLLVEDPSRLAIVSDDDYLSLLEYAPRRLDYVLVPEPVGVAGATDISRIMPGAYNASLPYLELVEEFPSLANGGNARLYRVIPQ